MYSIKRTDVEINAVMNFAAEGVESGTQYPGMKYEDGIQCALYWLFGMWDDAPM